jgi:branched-chain amino acid transport system substrate-binding protein
MGDQKIRASASRRAAGPPKSSPGKDLTGQKMLDALESGDKFLDIFNSPPTKFSKTDHLANTVTQVQQIQKGHWVLMKDSLSF